MNDGQTCKHIREAGDPAPSTPQGCEECLKAGDTWVHLRLCRTCGHVGCCDSSINKHATKHFHATRHPVIRSYQPGESWQWCYVDEVFAE
ncbi:MAG: UBP-type zinc finger domain-containing protein [Candidatus Tumulicola sp.]